MSATTTTTQQATERLMRAAAEGDIGGMRAALAEGASLGGTMIYGESRDRLDCPAEAAAHGSHALALAWLLDHGVSPDGGVGPRPAHLTGWPLGRAIHFGHRDCAELLIERGANPFAQAIWSDDRERLREWGLLSEEAKEESETSK